MCTQNCKTWCNIVTSAIGLSVGLSAFVVFFCVYKNFDAGFWGLVSGVFASVCFHLHYLHYRQMLDAWHSVETVDSMRILAMFGALAGVAGLIWYIFQAVYHHIPMMPVEQSMYIAAVWTFMTAKWSVMLFVYCHMYMRILHQNHSLL